MGSPLAKEEVEKLRLEERVLHYRTRMLVATAEWLKRFNDDRKDVVFNAMVECFAMQARIVMDLLEAPRFEKRPEDREDVKASDFSATWQPPTGEHFKEWRDQCDRAAAHPTTGAKPDWDEREIARTLVAEVRRLAGSPDAQMSPVLASWIGGLQAP
jgi:hypothetical protein